MKDLKLITIDFWNTLFDSVNHDKRYSFRNSVLLEEANKLGIEIENNKLDEAIKKSWEFFEDNWVNKLRTPNSQELVNVIWDHLNLPNEITSIKTVIKTYEDSLFEHPPVLIEGVREALPKLKENYKLGLISDTGYSPGTHLRKLMEDNEILEYFDSFSFSNETGVSKPHEKAFNTILHELNISPINSMHIGDIERTDIVGANNTGMHSVLYTGTDSEFDRKNPEVSSANIQINHWNELIEILEI
ncbi:MAG: HAD family hydrolase [Chlorobiota bacterium]|jgi:putative hydrolase of the HAD superfamily